ncbi:hypothetical protein HND97_18410 [Vibrio cholerae]|nr:hypothetical protein HND97_18410 [Vibrio cholerae]
MIELKANKERMLADLYQRMETMRNMDKVTEAGMKRSSADFGIWRRRIEPQ